MHHLFKRGILAYQIELLPSVSSIPLDVCFMSQLKRCSYISLPELILSARSPRRSIPVEFLSAVVMMDEDPESKDVKIKMTQ